MIWRFERCIAGFVFQGFVACDKCVAMATHEQWRTVRQLILDDPPPWRSRHMAQLWEYCRQDGLRALASFSQLGPDAREDLIKDVLVAELESILKADRNPRAYFLTTLRNRAIDWKRAPASRMDPEPEAGSAGDTPTTNDEERQVFRLDAHDLLASLSERDREILLEVAAGEEREDIAERYHTSRANVDKIVSRARKIFQEES